MIPFPLPAVAFPAALRAVAAVLLPVVLAASVLFYAVDNRLDYYGGNPTGFIQFGSAFAPFTHPPRDAIVESGSARYGYDGQFFYVMARDPLLLHDATVRSLDDAPQNDRSSAFGSANQGYRMERMAYPALAFLLSKALNISTAWSMLALPVVLLILLTGGFAFYARRRGHSTLWALALALLPGMLLATLRDLSGPLAAGTALGGVLLWTNGRRKLGVSLLVLAVLAREVMLAAVAALAVEAAVRVWRERRTPGAFRRTLRDVWPAIGVPVGAFVAWQAYVVVRNGGLLGGAGLRPPLSGFVHEVTAAGGLPGAMATWQIAYLALTLAAVFAALLSLRRGVSAYSAGAALFALTFLMAPFNDAWGAARDSLPMLALLLVVGLERRDSTRLGICAAAAAMTAFIPLGIPGSF